MITINFSKTVESVLSRKAEGLYLPASPCMIYISLGYIERAWKKNKCDAEYAKGALLVRGRVEANLIRRVGVISSPPWILRERRRRGQRISSARNSSTATIPRVLSRSRVPLRKISG